MSKDKNKKEKEKGLTFPVFINPKTDFGFKKVFGNRERMMAFLGAALSENITDIEYIPQERLGDREEDRKVVYDLYCRNKKGEQFIVEMQKASQKNFSDRALFYATYPIREQAPKGKMKAENKTGGTESKPWNYALNKVYFIAILNFTLFKEKSAKDIVVEEIELIRKKSGLVFTDKLKFKIIELPKFKKTETELETLMDKWLYSLKNMEYLHQCPEQFQEEIFKLLYEEAKLNNLKPEEMEAYNKSIMEYDDVVLAVDYAEERGEKRGEKKGEERGIKIGLQQAKTDVVMSAYRIGLSVEEIAAITNFTVEQVADILSKNAR
ncbi:MAG: Rpn family recombination-promoting nuclease/putative transposase [Prevotellaceae bacterium]|jgi:predicted transposase/invertase (TIGR01784 family)|nr:Rpn family recombination-promoting nuclease/putative transposase [Prevotellaceae bacterium]